LPPIVSTPRLCQKPKDQPSGVNSRLASYIERVRNLEAENQQLHSRLQDVAKGQHTNGSEIVGLYEASLEELRNQLDVANREKARLEFERDNAVAGYDVVKDQLSRMGLELETAQRDNTRYQEQVEELLRRAKSAEEVNADLLETVRELKCSNTKLVKDYKELFDLRLLQLDNELHAVNKLLNKGQEGFRIPLPSVKTVLLSVGAVVIGVSLCAGSWRLLGGGGWTFGGSNV